MKYLKNALCILVLGVGTNSLAYAQNVKFNHSKVQVGKIIESCYHNPCWGAKVVGFKQLQKTKQSAMLELTLLDYYRDWDSKKKDWSKRNFKIFVNCSITNPTITSGGSVTTIPINPDDVIIGALQQSWAIYSDACHGADNLDEMSLAKKYGYNITDW